MKISLITVCYNSAKTIADTLDSVAAQDYEDLEHIIVDGASQDGTLTIAGKYPHIAKLISEPDKGIYDAMNKGIACAAGDYIGFLNADDFYAHQQVVSHAATALCASSADALYGDLQYITPDQPFRVVRHWRAGSYRRQSFLYGWMPPHPTFLAHRGLFEQHGSFNTSLRSAADYELMLRFLYKHHAQAAYLPEVMVKMRTGGTSNASLRHRLFANREDSKAWAINGLRPYFFTVALKPLRKIKQWF